MKRTLLLVALIVATSLSAVADKGMWLPSLISSRIKDMKQKGFKLSAEDIYSINKASMKDAVVLFDGGCTGEIVTEQGLLLTNHHCGYDAIQALSTVEHDYLTNGFWAMSNAEELPCPGLKVHILVRMEEVTDRIAAGESRDEIIAKAEAEGKLIPPIVTEGAARLHTKTVEEMAQDREQARKNAAEADKAKERPAAK